MKISKIGLVGCMAFILLFSVTSRVQAAAQTELIGDYTSGGTTYTLLKFWGIPLNEALPNLRLQPWHSDPLDMFTYNFANPNTPEALLAKDLANQLPTAYSFGRFYLGDSDLPLFWGVGVSLPNTLSNQTPSQVASTDPDYVSGLRFWVIAVDGSQTDTDQDDVTDDLDWCPDTPAGATVLADGCEDGDGDGVSDYFDQCPATPAGATVVADGCEDGDGDGTSDPADEFPMDPVEDTDTDGDGIGDNGDTTPSGADGVGVKLIGAPVGCQFGAGSVVEEAVTATGAPGTAFGFQMNFTLENCGASPITVEAYFSEAPAPGAIPYKVTSGGEWIPIPGASIVDNMITYQLVDDGPLDEDTTTPNTIVDSVTAIEALAEPVPALHIWALWILACAAGLFGAARLRKVA